MAKDGQFPTIDVVMQGYAFATDTGHPALCGVFLIEGPDANGRPTRLLVDPAHVGRRPFLWDALAARNLTPQDIDMVAVTHAHWDHVQNIDVFAHAPLLLHPDEYQYSLYPHINDWATPSWTGLMLETMKIEEVREGDEIMPGVGIVDMPGHSPGSIGITVETADGLCVITGDAIHFAGVALTKVNPLVFWNVEQATRSIERVVDLADVIYPGHDQPFRVTAANEIEFLMKKEITLIGLTPGMPGVKFEDAMALSAADMPGIEEQVPRFESFRAEAERRRAQRREAGLQPARSGGTGAGATDHRHEHGSSGR